jgi:hypothetical protein
MTSNGQPGRRVAFVLAVLLCSVSALLWFLASISSPATNQSGAAMPPSYADLMGRDPMSFKTVEGVARGQMNGFSIFHTRPEPLPRGIKRTMRRASYGANWDLAQRIRNGRQMSLWLIPGREFLCLLQSGLDGLTQSCAPTQIALSHGLAIVKLNPPSRRGIGDKRRVIVGVGPDWADRVVVRTGTAVRASVVGSDGIFVVRDEVNAPPDQLLFR